MDGSQKLPQRLLSTVRDSLKLNHSFEHIALVIAGWMVYVSGIDEAGRAIEVRDPLAAVLRRRSDSAGADPAARVRALANIEAVFGQDLPASEPFITAVTGAYRALRRDGVRQAMANLRWFGHPQ